MSFFLVRNLPGYDFPAVAGANLAQVWVAYLALERNQWLSPAAIEEGQLQQVRGLLAHCIANIPYFRDALPRARIVPGAIRTMDDFRRIPLLPRRTYQENAALFEATRLPRGTVATKVRQTSGSSGSPTSVYPTNLVHLWWCACYLRDLEWSGIDPRGTLAAIRSTGAKGPDRERFLQGVETTAWLTELQALITTGAAHVMDVQQDHRVQLEWLKRIAPDYLLSYPANLEALAGLIGSRNALPSLKAIMSISDTLTAEARQTIEHAFGVPVKNTYSCAEVGYLASPCPAGRGWHVQAENVLLEILDSDGKPCPPGQTGHVYVTSLQNYRGPFLRYELGDQAAIQPEPCPCGRGLPRLSRIEGKSSPMFRLPDGRCKSSEPVARLVRKLGGHWQHQVVQKAVDHFVVRLAIDKSWTPRHAEELIQKLQRYFEAPMRVDIEIHERLPMPASGKFQSMVNEVGEG